MFSHFPVNWLNKNYDIIEETDDAVNIAIKL